MKPFLNVPPLKKVMNLASTVDRFVVQVVQSPEIESAWLSALSYLEEISAKQILGNISKLTPVEFLPEIEVHAMDETRHASEFARMRPIPEFREPRLLELERKLRALLGSFGYGYYGNHLLVTARNRHVAYVHGAMTIEQFPFQLYSAYLKVSRLPEVLRRLPSVLDDEDRHIALGAKMQKSLPPEAMLSLTELNEIEKDMCVKLVHRLGRVIAEFAHPASIAEDRLARMVNRGDSIRVAWIQALSHTEDRLGSAKSMREGSLRRGPLLRQTALLARRRYFRSPGYSAMEAEMSGALEIYASGFPATIVESRLAREYREFILESDDIGISHAVGVVAGDAEAVSGASAEGTAETISAEEVAFSGLVRAIGAAIARYESESSKSSTSGGRQIAV